MKKLISIILTACICLSLLGGISIAGAADATLNASFESYTYNFSAGEGDCKIPADTDFWNLGSYDSSPFCFFDVDENIQAVIDELKKEDAEREETLTFVDGNENYVVTISEISTRLLRVRNDYFRFHTFVEDKAEFPNGRWVAIKLDARKIPEGMFDVTLNGTDFGSGFDVYFAPYEEGKENGEEYLLSDNLIMSGKKGTTSVTRSDVVLTADATDYILIIKQNKSDEIRLTSLVFTRRLDYRKEHTKNNVVEYKFTHDSFSEDALSILEGSNDYIDDDNFISVNWGSVYGRNSVVDLSKTAPWSLSDYINLSGGAYATANRITDDFLRFDFNNNESIEATNKTRYENGYTGDATTTAPYFIIRTYVPNDGTFNVEISSSTKHNSGGVVDVYIAKAEKDKYELTGINDLKNAATKLGEYDTTASNPYMKAEATVELERGEYVFLFVPNEASKSKTGARTYISSITLTPTDDAGYTEAFTESDSTEENYAPNVTAYAYAKDNTTDITSSVTVSAKPNTGSGTYTLTAPETAGDNDEYKFIYWAKGLTTASNRQVVSTSATYTDYVPQNNNNFVIAVYDKGGNTPKAEFYNANGQLIETLDKDGNAPALPYMPGYNQASNWALHGTQSKINGGDPVTLSGNMLFFAEYDKSTPNSFEITVNGDSDTYNYGDLVTCSVPKTDTDGNILYGWKKTVNGVEKLVSADANYTFRAWEACTVTPVYKKTTGIIFDEAIRKIVLGTYTLGGEEAVMAEFIGFDDADEKGIILGTREIAMTSDNNQFTVVNNDKKSGISGYAILDGTKYIFNK